MAKELNGTYKEWVDDSTSVCRALETCVVLSRQPGTLPYRLGMKQDVESTEKKIERIRNLQAQIDACDAERKVMEDKKKSEYATVQPVSSFEEWFQKNGRPNHLDQPQYKWASHFVPSKKYVNHHGINDKTGTFDAKLLAEGSHAKSASITMHLGRLAGK